MCGLQDAKTQQELLCVPDLMVQIVLHKAHAAEIVYKEIQMMKDNSTSNTKMLNMSTVKACYHFGKTDHGQLTNCKFKIA